MCHVVLQLLLVYCVGKKIHYYVPRKQSKRKIEEKKIEMLKSTSGSGIMNEDKRVFKMEFLMHKNKIKKENRKEKQKRMK